MDNLEQKLKTLCHQNFIGSEKCGECNGKGWIVGEKIVEGVDYGHACDGTSESCSRNCPVPVPTQELEQCQEPCPTCKGKGYTIPLSFGCEVEVDGDCDYWVTGEYGGCKKHKRECGNNTERCEYQERVELTHTDMWGEYHKVLYFTDEIENLGKPLSLQDMLRLLDCPNLDISFWDNYMGIQTSGYEITIDLTKDLKDQPEVLQAIIDIVK